MPTLKKGIQTADNRPKESWIVINNQSGNQKDYRPKEHSNLNSDWTQLKNPKEISEMMNDQELFP